MATLRSNCTMLAVMFEFANRVADRSPPLNSTSTASAFGHVDHLVGDRFHFVARVHRRVQGSRFRFSSRLSRSSVHGSPAASVPAPAGAVAGRRRRSRPPSAPAGGSPADAPTIPGLDSRLTRFAPWHAGHSGARAAVTNASNSRSQSLHSIFEDRHGADVYRRKFQLPSSKSANRGFGCWANSRSCWLRPCRTSCQPPRPIRRENWESGSRDWELTRVRSRRLRRRAGSVGAAGGVARAHAGTVDPHAAPTPDSPASHVRARNGRAISAITSDDRDPSCPPATTSAASAGSCPTGSGSRPGRRRRGSMRRRVAASARRPSSSQLGQIAEAGDEAYELTVTAERVDDHRPDSRRPVLRRADAPAAAAAVRRARGGPGRHVAAACVARAVRIVDARASRGAARCSTSRATSSASTT